MTGTGGRVAVSAIRLAVAAVVIVAIVVQLIDASSKTADYSYANFFSFFTIQSNIIGAASMIVAAVVWRARGSVRLSQFRGAATLYMAITGVVFNLLLRDITEQLQTTLPWVNTVLHVAFPIVIVIDWLVDRTVHRLSYRQGLVFLVYPIAYLVYTLIRGPLVDWYPYPFLDPRSHGYGYVIIMSVIVAVICFLLAWVVCWSSRWGAARPVGDAAARTPVR